MSGPPNSSLPPAFSYHHSPWFLSDDSKLRWLALERLDKFRDERVWQDKNLSRNQHLFSKPIPLKLSVYSVPNLERPRFPVISELYRNSPSCFLPASLGSSYGPSWATHWFHVEAEIPAENYSGQILALRWDSNCEGLIYSPDGIPLQGFTGGNGAERRAEFLLNKGKPIEILQNTTYKIDYFIEIACNALFGNCVESMIGPPVDDRKFSLALAEVSIFDQEYEIMTLEYEIVLEMAKSLPKEHFRAVDAMKAATEFVSLCNPRDRTTWPGSRAVLQKFLSVKNGDGGPQVFGLGHCHIDNAWLWTQAETQRKVVRSWSTQVELMDHFPQYHFTASQAAQFNWLKQREPELFKKIQSLAASGRFQPQGGSWVEFDANLTSGESMVRQLLYGQRFFKEHFGSYCPVFWLPDTFGYSHVLPQLLNSFHFSYFLTQKLSWNLLSTFPHHTFQWIGNDGKSSILTHFPPSDSYADTLTVKSLQKSWENNKTRGIGESLQLFGFGDGGGGPNRSMIQRGLLMENLSGLPKLSLNTNAETFFQDLQEKYGPKQEFPSWTGDLYLEIHRGTFTTHACLKLANRSLENIMKWAEFVATIEYHRAIGASENSSIDSSSIDYPREIFHQSWENILLNQFHDVLPGSCISDVVRDAMALYKESYEKIFHGIESFFQQFHHGNTGKSPRIVEFWPKPKQPAEPPCTEEQYKILMANRPPAEQFLKQETNFPHSMISSSFHHPDSSTLPPSPMASGDSSDFPSATRSLDEFLLYNPLNWPRLTLLSLPVPIYQSGDSSSQENLTKISPRPCFQSNSSNNSTYFLANLPECGVLTLNPLQIAPLASSSLPDSLKQFNSIEIHYDDEENYYHIENSHYRVKLSKYGEFSSFRDLSHYGREIIAGVEMASCNGSNGSNKGKNSLQRDCKKFNQFLLYDDKGLYWDAWDVELYHLQTLQNIGNPLGNQQFPTAADDIPCRYIPERMVSILESGPLLIRLEIRGRLTENSSFLQRISFFAHTSLIEFDTELEWCESHRLLKIGFPLNLYHPVCEFSSQFSSQQRSTQRNSIGEIGKFELSAQEFINYQEGQFGISLLNNGKYGFSVENSHLTMSIVRSSKKPDPTADIGKHQFKYGIYSHSGIISQSQTIQLAKEFNQPITIIQRQRANSYSSSALTPPAITPAVQRFFSFHIPQTGIVLEAVKRAELPLKNTPNYHSALEEAEKSIILRFYECFGSRSHQCLLTIHSSLGNFFPLAQAYECNGLEENLFPLSWKTIIESSSEKEGGEEEEKREKAAAGEERERNHPGHHREYSIEFQIDNPYQVKTIKLVRK